MAAPSRFRWYHFQLLLAAGLQFLSLFAPLSYGGNWGSHTTAFLHPLWITTEKADFAARTFEESTVWFFFRPELILLVVWMVALGFLMCWVILGRISQEQKIDRLGKAMGGFAAQILLAYFIAQSVTWHVAAGEDLELRILPQFFLLLFPLILSYLAWKRMKKEAQASTD